MPIPQHIRHQPGPKVPRQINRIPGLPPKASSNTKDDKEQSQRRQGPRAEIPIVLQREDHEHEDRARQELGEELARLRHELGRVGTEDAGCCGRRVAWHGAEMGPAFVDVDGGFVVAIDDGGAAHGAEELGEQVDGEFVPGEAAEDAVGEGYRWVDVRSGGAAGVDA